MSGWILLLLGALGVILYTGVQIYAKHQKEKAECDRAEFEAWCAIETTLFMQHMLAIYERQRQEQSPEFHARLGLAHRDGTTLH